MSSPVRCSCGRPLPDLTPGRADPVVCESCGAEHTPLPERIRKLKFEEILGQGGMGVVYKALDVDLDRPVAVKVMAEDLVADPAFVERFYREARAAAAVADPNIVQIYDVGHEGRHYYIVMEYVDGRPLSAWLARRRAMPLGQALDFMEQALRALSTAHARGILHRDVKPSNLMVDAAGRIKLADFGLAKRAGGEASLTATGVIVGTPPYMSPEQARGGELDARSDLYSLGVVFFEMLGGRLPFEADTPVALMMKHAGAEPAPPVRRFNRRVPAPLSKFLARMLEKDPARRFGGAAGALEALAKLRPKLNVKLELPLQPTDRPRAAAPLARVKPRQWLPAAVGMAVLAVAGAVTFFTRDRGAADPPIVVDRPAPEPDWTAAREKIGAGAWADAVDAYRDGGPRGATFAALAAEMLDVERLLGESDIDAAGPRLEALQREVDRFERPEERVVWSAALETMRGRLKAERVLHARYDAFLSVWPKPDDTFIGNVDDFARPLLALPEGHPIRRKTEAWLAAEIPKLFERCEAIVAEGRESEATNYYTAIERVFPTEPWVTTAREGRIRAGRLQARKGKPELPPDFDFEPRVRIPLDFIPSAFTLTEDSRHLVALHRHAGEAVVLSTADGSVVRRIGVGNEPTCVAHVGDRLLVGGRTASDLRLYDATTWEPAGSIDLGSPNIGSIAVARACDPPRVFVSTSEEILEVDPTARSIVTRRPYDIVQQPYPRRLTVLPGGELLYAIQQSLGYAYTTDGALVPFRSTGDLKEPTVDGQGQYLVDREGVFDPGLRKVTSFDPHVGACASHPGLPYAFYFSSLGSSIEVFDLYRIKFVDTVRFTDLADGWPRGEFAKQGFEDGAVVSPDGRTLFAGVVQHARIPEDVEGPSTIYGLALPVAKPEDGYFAFTGPFPDRAAPGFGLNHVVRLSEPYAKRARITLDYRPEGAKWIESQDRIVWVPTLAQTGEQEIRLRATDPKTGIEITRVMPIRVSPRELWTDPYAGQPRLTSDGRYAYTISSTAPATLGVYSLDADAFSSATLPARPSAADYSDGRLYMIDPTDDRTIRSVALPECDDPREHPVGPFIAIDLVARGRDGGMMAVVKDEEGKTHLASLEGSRPRALLKLHGNTPPAVSPDGTVMIASSEGQRRLYRWQDGGFKELSSSPIGPQGVTFSADGLYCYDGKTMYEVRGMREVRTFDGGRLRFDPTGPYAGFPSGDGVEILKLGSWERAERIELPAGIVYGSAAPVTATPLSSHGMILIYLSGNRLIPHDFR